VCGAMKHVYAVQYRNFKPGKGDFFHSRAKAIAEIHWRVKRYYTLRGDYKVIRFVREAS